MGVNCRRRTMPFVGTLAVLALATLRGANAQDTTNATCLSNYSFLYNSKGQSPCLVAAYVAGVCNGGQFNVPALIDGAHYTGPLTSDANNCLCSSIFYCLMSACGLCQNGPVITWTDWTKNCSTVYLTVYPENIPSVTAIPAWAYVNFSATDSFNLNDAQALQSSPESTGSYNQVTLTATGVANPTNSGSASTKSSNTGAIAGGAVGGVVVIALAALLAFFLIRRRSDERRNTVDLSAQFSAHSDTLGTEKQSSGQQSHGEYVAPELTGSTLPTQPSQRLYDPDDPSTFPRTPAPGYFVSPLNGPAQYGGGPTAAPGTYHGVAGM